MSQITRCPACGTTFKVVADQLRISDGWVRCGQCKDVFDASAHLLPAGPAKRGAPPSGTASPGDRPQAAAGPVPATATAPAPAPASPAAPERSATPSAAEARPVVPPDAQGTHARPLSPPAQASPPAVLPRGFPPPPEPSIPAAGAAAAVPDAAPVPAFLERRRDAATLGPEADAPGQPWSLEPVSPLAWRVRPPGSPLPAPAPAPTQVPQPSGAADAFVPVPSEASVPVSARVAPHRQTPDPLVGYELPFAELRDSGWPEEFDTDAYAGGLRDEGPAPPSAGRSDASDAFGRSEAAPEDGGPPSSLPPEDDALEQELARELAHEGVDVDTDPVDVATQAMPLAADAALAEEAAVPAPSVWRSARNAATARAASGATRRRGLRGREGDDDYDGEEDDGPGGADGDEPGFVRAARRKAWWRRPAVRIALGAAGVLLLGVLLLQVALQERDRLASQYPAIRPLLQVLCAPLQCRIDPPRRIADVVIDSSAFNKARGDGYVLAVTLRSRADFPVATPALELTLTDAQEQPVLRRVLMPQDLNAPTELPAGGDWGGSWPVSVAGAAAPRVAGYRLLAFYP